MSVLNTSQNGSQFTDREDRRSALLVLQSCKIGPRLLRRVCQQKCTNGAMAFVCGRLPNISRSPKNIFFTRPLVWRLAHTQTKNINEAYVKLRHTLCAHPRVRCTVLFLVEARSLETRSPAIVVIQKYTYKTCVYTFARNRTLFIFLNFFFCKRVLWSRVYRLGI